MQPAGLEPAQMRFTKDLPRGYLLTHPNKCQGDSKSPALPVGAIDCILYKF